MIDRAIWDGYADWLWKQSIRTHCVVRKIRLKSEPGVVWVLT